jgi:DNA polymerase-3 subunit delta'
MRNRLTSGIIRFDYNQSRKTLVRGTDATMTALYPWLDTLHQSLVEQIRQDRLPHALLVTGHPGVGKLALARHLVQMLLCGQRSPEGLPCGQCPACLQLQAGTHPDFQRVQPEEDSQVIKVDQVRALYGALSLCAHAQGFKTAIISPAEAMNVNAANSLLKTLEEPSDNTVLVLVSDQPAHLPATVRSRCQQVRVNVPDRGQALDWLTKQLPDASQADICLQLAHGAPLAALALAREGVIDARRERLDELVGILDGRTTALEIAQGWCKDEGMQGIRWLRDWLMDLLRIRLTGQTQAVRSVDLADGLAALAARLDSRIMFGQLDMINRMLRSGTGSLNQQLMTEDILLAWAAQQ